jgi:hypothetical protein
MTLLTGVITVLAVLVLVVAALLLYLLRFGVVRVRVAEFPVRKSRFTTWGEVFRLQGRFVVTPWQTGSIRAKSRAQFLDKGNPRIAEFQTDETTVPVWAYHLEHPEWGDMMIDTGFDESFSSPRHGNYNAAGRLYTALNGTRHLQSPGESLNDRLRQSQASPTDVFFTHPFMLKCGRRASL